MEKLEIIEALEAGEWNDILRQAVISLLRAETPNTEHQADVKFATSAFDEYLLRKGV